MKFTKTLKYSAAALVASLVLVGCGNQETETKVDLVTNTGDGVTVEFWHNMSGAFAETIDSIVSDFNWEKINGDYLQFFEKCLAGQKGRPAKS